MIHRDIKPANILLNRRGDFKVGNRRLHCKDAGLSLGSTLDVSVRQ